MTCLEIGTPIRIGSILLYPRLYSARIGGDLQSGVRLFTGTWLCLLNPIIAFKQLDNIVWKPIRQDILMFLDICIIYILYENKD